jgi:hypothetical protein
MATDFYRGTFKRYVRRQALLADVQFASHYSSLVFLFIYFRTFSDWCIAQRHVQDKAHMA